MRVENDGDMAWEQPSIPYTYGGNVYRGHMICFNVNVWTVQTVQTVNWIVVCECMGYG